MDDYDLRVLLVRGAGGVPATDSGAIRDALHATQCVQQSNCIRHRVFDILVRYFLFGYLGLLLQQR